MPKTQETQTHRMRRFIGEFGDVLTIQIDDKTKSQVLYCQSCLCVVSSDQRSHVEQHLRVTIHKTKVKDYKTKQISVQHMIKNS